ncbi:asparaginase [Candidatus Woesearchaeota archaeon]|nr:asparaginase [Candidatus Woesearchaeota archaeon]
MAIKVFITGGTIDNLDYDTEGEAPKDQKTIIPNLLKRSKISFGYDIEMVCFKDSRFLDDHDRELLLKKCKGCPEEKIIVTHGTMTMPTTAQFLGRNKLPKTIVLAGSAIPGNKPNSDALFNLGFAFGAVQVLPPGVYVAMNGKIFLWNNVKKNLDTGFFEAEE